MLITIGGPSGAGKTTLCRRIAAANPGQVRVPSLPYWPSFFEFIENPRAFAYQNQLEAMETVTNGIRDALEQDVLVITDSDPVRVHEVHTWLLHEQGLISETECTSLREQFLLSADLWSGPYFILDASDETLRRRVSHRGREEDRGSAQVRAEHEAKRWRALCRDTSWAGQRAVHAIDAGRSPSDVEQEVRRISLWLGIAI